MLGNLIHITKINASSLTSGVQNENLDQLAKGREGNARSIANQAQDSNQKSKAPNEINAHIGLRRPRLAHTKDIIDISKIKSVASADSLENQAVKSESKVGSPVAPSRPWASALFGNAYNGAWQKQNSGQDVDSVNDINPRIDQPGRELHVSYFPTANIFVDDIDSDASGTNVQVQDLDQDATVEKNPTPYPFYCPPARPGGHASNAGDQIAHNAQDINSKNFVDVIENIGRRPLSVQGLDPTVTNINSKATGDNIQAQSASQDALTEARNLAGANASSRLFEEQTNDQKVDSANVINMRVNDRVNAFQVGLVKKVNADSTAANLQDSTAHQSAASEWRGAGSNKGEQTQWSGQTSDGGNWINVNM